MNPRAPVWVERRLMRRAAEPARPRPGARPRRERSRPSVGVAPQVDAAENRALLGAAEDGLGLHEASDLPLALLLAGLEVRLHPRAVLRQRFAHLLRGLQVCFLALDEGLRGRDL